MVRVLAARVGLAGLSLLLPSREQLVGKVYLRGEAQFTPDPSTA